MTARLPFALAAAVLLIGSAPPLQARADAPVRCSADRARALERQGRGEAAGSGASLARAVEHLKAASGEYTLCATQASGSGPRLAFWTQAQSSLRAAVTADLQVGTTRDVDALLAAVRNYDVAIAADAAIAEAPRATAHHNFDASCLASTSQGDMPRETVCANEYASVAAERSYLALMPGYHAALIDAAASTPAPFAAGSTTTMIAMPDGLRYVDTVVGTGPVAKFGQHVTMNYVGKLADGTVFDSSGAHSGGFDFTIGTGNVIDCWDEGVIGMHVGGHRTLVCPPAIAYGGRSQGVIPPYSTLHFDVELVSIRP